jgi:hypothetical protein
MTVTKSATIAFAALAAGSRLAAAQIGVSVVNDTTSKVEILFVQSAKGATLANGKLSLTGIAPTTVFFSDRPHRIAGHVATREMIPLWSEGKDSFLKDPPNATLSSFTSDGDVVNAVVVLRNPTLTGTTMTYDVLVTQGSIPKSVDSASLFIDVIGMPLTPLSYAGAARRTYRRAVIY